jgi:hypothetical protein
MEAPIGPVLGDGPIRVEAKRADAALAADVRVRSAVGRG